MSERPGSPDSRLFDAVRSLGGAALGLGVAASLSSIVPPFPGAVPRADVVGRLLESGLTKAAEFGLFYGALLLVPLGALVFSLPGLRATRLPVVSVAVAVASVLFELWRDGRSVVLLVAVPALALLVLPAVARAGEAFLGRLRESPGGRPIVGRTGRAVGLALVAATLSFAVLALAIGPRVLPRGPLDESLARVAAVVAACGGVVVGLLLVTTACELSPAAVARALRHTTWLLAARLAPESPTVLGVSVGASVVGVVTSLVRHPEVDPEEARRELPRFFTFVFLPALVTVLVFHCNVHGDLDLYHAGEWLTPGAMLLEGQVPYRDVYLQHGLGQNALRSWLTFVTLGPTYVADVTARHVSYGLVHAALLLLLLATLRSRLLALVLALAVATPGLAVSPRLLFLFLALAFVGFDLREARDDRGRPTPRRRRWTVLAGVSTALALFHSVDAGLFAALAIGPFLLVEGLTRRDAPGAARVGPALGYLAGLVAGAAPILLGLVAVDAGDAFLANTRDQLSLQLSVWGTPFPSPRELAEVLDADGLRAVLGLPQFRGLLAAAAALGALSVFAVRARAGRARRSDWTLLLLGLAGAALFRTALGRSDAGHLAYSAALLWPTLAVAAEAAWRSATSRPSVRALPGVLLAVLLVAGHVPIYGMARQWLRLSELLPMRAGGDFSYAPLPRLAGVLMPREKALALTTMGAWLDEHLPPRAPVFEFSNMGAIHFLFDRTCPTRFVQPVYAATPAQQRTLVADLERTRPRFMVTSGLLGNETVDGIPLATRLPIVTAHLAETYRLREVLPFGAVFERADAPSAREPLGDRVADEPADDR